MGDSDGVATGDPQPGDRATVEGGRMTVRLQSRLALPLDPMSVRRARQHVSETLVDAGRSEWVDAAALAVTEIVANVVLHARTSCELSVNVADDRVRVSVRDFSADLPAQQHFSDYATTGRGLSLVVRLTADFGVDPLGHDGKVVWFVVDGVARDVEPDAPSEEWDLTGLELLADGPDPDTSSAVLASVPMVLWLACLEHQAAVLRELYLLAATTSRAPANVAVDLAAAEAVLRALSDASTRALEKVTAAPAVLDVVVVTTGIGAGTVNAFQDALDLGQRLAVDGRLLVRPALDELVALRDWACDQVVAQTSGVPGTPWDGSEVHHAAPVPASYRLPDWDDTAVRTSPRAVVAADDSNRLIAISATAAELLGWAAGDLVGRRITTIIPPRLRAQHVAGFTRHLATGERHLLGAEIELPVLRSDGREVVRRFLIEQVSAPAGRRVYLAWLDPIPGASTTGC